LHGDVCSRKIRSAEDETSKEGKINAAWHLEERVEIVYRGESPEPPGEAHSSAAPKHCERVHKGRISDQVKHLVNALALRDVFGQVGRFNFCACGAKFDE